MATFGDPSMFGNIHKDLLDASAETDEEREKLVEECKKRAKQAFAAKEMPAANVLYTKAIDTIKLPEAALFSNRSAVRLALGTPEEALKDAKEAVKTDKDFSKAYYRLGQALERLKKHKEAAKAYADGGALEPENKVFKSSQTRAEKAAEDAKKAPEPVKKAEAAPALDTYQRRAPPTEKEAAAATGAAPQTEEEKEAAKMRGYKVTADGRRTTFFNNELTEEDKKLIGDIAPKKIQAPVKMDVTEGNSDWNQAGTFEEKSLTKWAKGRLEELLVGLSFEVPNMPDLECSVWTTGVSEVKGDVSVTRARGKTKHIFDLQIKIEWNMPVWEGLAKGTIHLPDVSGDTVDEGDIEFNVEVNKLTPSSAKDLIDAYVKREDQGIMPLLRQKLTEFTAEVRTK